MFLLLLQGETKPKPAAGQVWRHKASPETNVEVIEATDAVVFFEYGPECPHVAKMDHFQKHFEFAGLVPHSKN